MGSLFLGFALLSWVELSLLVRLGRVLGGANLLLMLLVSGVVGIALARSQGRKVLRAFREASALGRVPEEGVLGGALAVFGGVLLALPGVLSDVLGLLCLIPSTRRLLTRSLQRYLERRAPHAQVRMGDVGMPWTPPSARAAGPTRRPAPPTPGPYDVIDTEGEEVPR